MSTVQADTGARAGEGQRSMFYRLAPDLLAQHSRAVLVLAEIGASYLERDALAPVAERVVNVGIREQLAIGLAGGLALAGLRPIVHTFAPFLLERPFEQVKLDLGHQGVGAVLVSTGGSYDWPAGGQTHFGHRDVALLDTLSGWTVHTPGHREEAEHLLRTAVGGEGRVYLRLDDRGNTKAHSDGGDAMTVLRRGTAGTVIAVGPMADRVLAATTDLDVTVLYAATVRPLDVATVRATLATPAVVIVEPYLTGTSTHLLAAALSEMPHRLLALGVSRTEHRHYGTPEEHDVLHSLDVAGLRASITAFLHPDKPG